jgi:hypothetical protein
MRDETLAKLQPEVRFPWTRERRGATARLWMTRRYAFNGWEPAKRNGEGSGMRRALGAFDLSEGRLRSECDAQGGGFGDEAAAAVFIVSGPHVVAWGGGGIARRGSGARVPSMRARPRFSL